MTTSISDYVTKGQECFAKGSFTDAVDKCIKARDYAKERGINQSELTDLDALQTTLVTHFIDVTQSHVAAKDYESAVIVFEYTKSLASEQHGMRETRTEEFDLLRESIKNLHGHYLKKSWEDYEKNFRD